MPTAPDNTPPMTDRPDNSLWFADQPTAEAVAELLRAEGVPAEVEVRQPVPGPAEALIQRL